MSGRAAACSRLLLRASAFRSIMSAMLGVGNAGTAHERSLPLAMGNCDRRRVIHSLQWRASGDSGGMHGGDSGSAARSALALPMPPSPAWCGDGPANETILSWRKTWRRMHACGTVSFWA